ncbi:MAG: hypothetical protein ACW987_14180 [Candidatus Thorarchaeota archaeon]|jgi:hypothetical protein
MKDGESMKKYTRLYSDENGETHFEDVEIELLPVDFAPPAPPLNLSALIEAKRYGFVNAPVGWYGDWHPAGAGLHIRDIGSKSQRR